MKTRLSHARAPREQNGADVVMTGPVPGPLRVRARVIALAVGATVLGYAIWLATAWDDDQLVRSVNGVLGLVAAVAALLACAIAFRRRAGRRRLVWLCFGVGSLGWLTGQSIRSYAQFAHDELPAFPGPGDAGFLIFPIAALIAVVVLPRRRRPSLRWVRAGVDAAIVAASLLVLAMDTGLTDSAADGDAMRATLTVCYPVLDIAMATTALLMLSRQVIRGDIVPIVLLAASMLSFSVADSGRYYTGISHPDATGVAWLGVCWPLAFVCLALAAARAAFSPLPIEDPTAPLPAPVSPRWLGLILPYLPVVAAFALITGKVLASGQRSTSAVLLTLALALLVLLRQFLALADNRRLLVQIARSQDQLLAQSFRDPLTGLPNRAGMEQALHEHIATLGLDDEFGLLVLDIDRFKEINETLGHQHGDRLLVHVSQMLAATIRTDDRLARLGDDEFAVLLPASDLRSTTGVAERLRAVLQEPKLVNGIRLGVDASIGIVIAGHTDRAQILLQHADIALHDAKEQGAPYATYRPAAESAGPARVSLLADLRLALARTDEFQLYYQPKISLHTGEVRGVEALLRWQHPERGMVAPGEFIPIAERTGVIGPITERVLAIAIAQARDWLDQGWEVPVAVNVSARSLHDPSLPDLIQRLLARYDLPARLLTLEITEGAIMLQPDRAHQVLNLLRDWGVRLSLDDFGTGYSSMTYIKDLPVSELKVDQSFVTDMVSHPRHAVIVKAIIDLGHNLGMTVVAEGIETSETLHQLRTLGCDIAQGYLISRPRPVEVISAWLEQRLQRATAVGRGERER